MAPWQAVAHGRSSSQSQELLPCIRAVHMYDKGMHGFAVFCGQIGCVCAMHAKTLRGWSSRRSARPGDVYCEEVLWLDRFSAVLRRVAPATALGYVWCEGYIDMLSPEDSTCWT